MGTEFSGASDFMMEHADAFVEIPMHGFAESFNISVAAAILMQRLRGTFGNLLPSMALASKRTEPS